MGRVLRTTLVGAAVAVGFALYGVTGGGRPGAATVPLSFAPAVGLDAVFNTAVGRSEPSFAIGRRGGLSLARGGGIVSRFGGRGPVLSVPGGTVAFLPARLARSGVPVVFRRLVAPAVHGAEAVYARGTFREWYRNGPLGLEQGFTLSSRPPGHGPLLLVVPLAGTLSPVLADGGVVFRAAGDAAALRYADVRAVDVSGRPLPVTLGLSGRRIMLRIDDVAARYPVTVDPLVQTGAKLLPSDPTPPSEFGYSVALSSDGTTALIGGPNDNHTGAPGEGAVWVFTRSGSSWTQQGSKIVPTDGGGYIDFGVDVDLSSDGNTAVVGADYTGSQAGAAFVFRRSGSSWTQQARLTGGKETGAGHFGAAVTISGDGSTVAVGAPENSGGQGAVWTFHQSAGSWSQVALAFGTGEGGNGQFGSSVSYSRDGSVLAVGAPADGASGAVFMFTSTAGGLLTQAGPKTAPIGSGSMFGARTAVDADGGVVAVGAPTESAGPTSFSRGVVYTLVRSGSVWVLTGRILPTDEDGSAAFGHSVALTDDGGTLLVGGVGEGLGSDANTGAAWLFQGSGTHWSETGTRIRATGEVGQGGFGASAALSSDGTFALVGGYWDDANAGAVWPFEYSAIVPPSTTTTTTSSTTTTTTSSTTTGSTTTTTPRRCIPIARPRPIPLRIPKWAVALVSWVGHGEHGKRPVTPKPLPSWYGIWRAWVHHPCK